MRIGFQHGLLDGHWQSDVVLDIDSAGRITDLSTAGTADKKISGFVLPGIPNVHSHAFQWTFAGQSEYRTRKRDSFWSWRERMYESVERLTPEAYYHSARRLFQMMLAAGYCEVGEFHYIHNAPTGEPYANRAEMAHQLVRAATDVGIAICLLPVLYQRGGFDNRPLAGAQRRFYLDDDSFFEVCRELQGQWGDHPLFQLGIAFHSLRSVDPERLSLIVQQVTQLLGPVPVHIHVAEQLPEVQDSLQETGLRPVDLLLKSVQVDHRWCLIHATHMTQAECVQLAETGAVVGVCPTTEANLGDGIFPAITYLDAGGRIAFGSDSHVALSPAAELRLLEYGQRLTTNRRAVLCREQESCGTYLYRSAVQGGQQSLTGRDPGPGGWTIGQRADWIVLDDRHAVLADIDPERFLDRWVFCQWGDLVRETWVAGQRVFCRSAEKVEFRAF